MCAEHREVKTKRVRFSADTSTRSLLADDDFLQAFQAPKCLKGDKREALAQHVLHIDHAHTLSLGFNGQRYYLVMVIDGVDFLWASSSKHKSDPETLLDEFLRFTNIKIDKIRMDAASEYATSESFQLWCASRGIVMCSTAGYNHTMQARAENAVRITKEHIRCMLKHANMPFQFWPWALTQFCRVYNYWPSKGHAPPWVMLGDHRFSQSLHSDLHPFGCYLIGKLPREHPAVKNTTLSDRGLEGAFLGWDLSTPTVWLWSFRLRKPVQLHDPVFYDHLFPFDDPSCLINKDMTADDVNEMHQQGDVLFEEGTHLPDTPDEELTESDEEEEPFSTPPTQPCEPVRRPKPTQQLPALDPTPSPSPAPRPVTRSQTPPPVPAPVSGETQPGETLGSQPESASLDVLSDKQLGRAVVHHKMILQVPKDLTAK
mmetsp:Transcript_30789/g.63725  ORF Transcript_30789/g.63725 Transcript_30789/m.63725 type:complete len:429 (+) Transcript_30789:837-2123(+)